MKMHMIRNKILFPFHTLLYLDLLIPKSFWKTPKISIPHHGYIEKIRMIFSAPWLFPFFCFSVCFCMLQFRSLIKFFLRCFLGLCHLFLSTCWTRTIFVERNVRYFQYYIGNNNNKQSKWFGFMSNVKYTIARTPCIT